MMIAALPLQSLERGRRERETEMAGRASERERLSESD
jgi:hypothetical protein